MGCRRRVARQLDQVENEAAENPEISPRIIAAASVAALFRIAGIRY